MTTKDALQALALADETRTYFVEWQLSRYMQYPNEIVEKYTLSVLPGVAGLECSLFIGTDLEALTRKAVTAIKAIRQQTALAH